ncbi:max-like protein x [Dermatophagoides farinae]|uniref:Max-like protein x n=1 Tax=Dermatophagoides farinae TaxID=6954 RepID=A0A9D4NZ22_DERFA|nr:max-like protein X [Dermatophagoides farinae]KAH7640877.1 max-like protein x [Dermatophagoides farinae]
MYEMSQITNNNNNNHHNNDLTSMDTSDDDDSDQKSNNNNSYKERRREAHTQAEQKRRDAIKKGYEDLQLLVPSCTQQDAVSSYKLSKAAILQRSIEYIQTLQQQKHKREKELQTLRKEVLGLEIMRNNYEQMVHQQQQQQQQQQQRRQQQTSQQSSQISSDLMNYNNNEHQMISDEMKFEIFKTLCDGLFLSFDDSVNVGSFNQLSACTFRWLEDQCQPRNLRQIMVQILEQLKTQIA